MQNLSRQLAYLNYRFLKYIGRLSSRYTPPVRMHELANLALDDFTGTSPSTNREIRSEARFTNRPMRDQRSRMRTSGVYRPDNLSAYATTYCFLLQNVVAYDLILVLFNLALPSIVSEAFQTTGHVV